MAVQANSVVLSRIPVELGDSLSGGPDRVYSGGLFSGTIATDLNSEVI